jgi:PEP-CTERM motif
VKLNTVLAVAALAAGAVASASLRAETVSATYPGAAKFGDGGVGNGCRRIAPSPGDKSAAAQNAASAIMFGTAEANGRYDLNGPTLNASAGITGGAIARTWMDGLGAAPSAGNYEITYLYEDFGAVVADNSQNRLAYPTAPAPKPKTYTMLLSGLGLMVLLARRRKKSRDPSA